MKAVTLYVDEDIYREFQDQARQSDRSTAELIRDAMELYRRRWRQEGIGIRELAPLSLGEIHRPLQRDDDLLGEMLG